MGSQFKQLNKQHKSFIEAQSIFFVATAAQSGKVNLSPKGGDAFRIINDNQVAWLNLTGSGNETAAHIQLTPRMTIMFCAFDGPPIILRLYGKATAIHEGDAAWDTYIDLFPDMTGRRQIFLLDVEMVQTSCGMAVPLYDYVSDRTALTDWADKQGRDGIKAYWEKKNQQSLDGFDTNILALSASNDE